MSNTFLREEIGVAMSGVKWDVANYKLWQSTRPDIILFTPKQPRLAKSSNGRYQAAVSQFRQQTDGTYKITGGSSIFTITSAIEHDANAFEKLKEQWMSEMNAKGPKPHRNPRFIPLNVQKGTARVLINEASGKADDAHNDAAIGTPGGTNSFLVNLTDLGAQEWVQGIKEGKGIPGGVKMDYEYLRMMPDCGAEVKVHGRRMFRHISSELKVDYNNFFYGGSAQIEAAWEKMVRNGTVEITYIGTLPPELEEIRQELTSTFADQARQQLFDSLFQPKPDIEDAEAGDHGGIFGGASFAFKYRKEEEITDLRQTIRFKGWTWLKASMDADLTALLHELDESYVNEVNTEMSFPASLVVDSDPQLENVAVSWSASEGKAPEAPVYGPEGGNTVYTVTSAAPDNVEISYTAKVNFEPSSWPPVTTSGRSKVSDGGNQTIIKPASWIGRHMIYLFVQENGQIKMMGAENDYLIVNVTYNGPHLSRPIRASSRISIFEPVEFTYPLSPVGEIGEAKFSAFGVVGGKLMRSREQAINFDEEAVFILADENKIELVSQATFAPENSLESQLKFANARPVITGDNAPSGNRAVEHYRRVKNSARPMEGGSSPASDPAMPQGAVTGTVVAVNYSIPALIVEKNNGERLTVPLRNPELAYQLDDSRKQVRLQMAEDGYPSSVTVLL